MMGSKMQSDISEVGNCIDLIQSVMDELATLRYCSNQEAEKIVSDVRQDLERWNKPGVDSALAAYHFKCLAYHILSLIHCRAINYDFLKIASRYLSWSLTCLLDEQDGLKGLLDLQNTWK